MKSLFETYLQMKEAVNQTAGDDSMPKGGPTADVCPKCKKNPCECDSVAEELKGGQVKLDKNKNGKLDADDFKKLRKEDAPFEGPYTTSFKKAKNPSRTGMDAARALAQKAMKTAIIQGHEKFTSSKDKLKPKHFGMSEDFSDEEIDDMINEVLSKDAKAGDWIDDFIKSDNPKFAGKSKEKRKQMALAAYYSKQRNEEVELTEGYEEIKVHSKEGKHIGTITHGKYQSVAYAHPTTKFGAHKDPHPDEDSIQLAGHHETQKGIDFIHAHHRLMSESVEQLQELSPKTYGSYIKKAKASAIGSSHVMGMGSKMTGQKTQDKAEKTVEKRAKGINKAVDRLTKEEVDLQEANHREFAAAGKMHPDMAKHMTVGNEMDFYAHGTGDKMSGKVMKNTGKEVHIKTTTNPYKEKDSSVHKFKVASSLEESSEHVSPYVKTQNYTWGKMKTIHHGNHFSIPLHPEHHEAISKLEDGQEHHFKTEDGKHWGAYRRGSDVHFQSADEHGANKTTVSHASMREEKEEHMKTFKEFIEEAHEYKAGRYVHKGTYGTSHDDPGVKSKPFWHTADKDDEEKKAEKPAEKAVKRGRGRPAGSKSGARQFGAASKDGSGADYTGYKLHLPNSNK